MPRLIVKKGRAKTDEFNFPYEDIVTIGRSRDNDVVLHDRKKKVSRYHAALIRDYRGDYWIRDLGSLNLTRVGAEIVYRQPLNDNSTIQIGDFKITYRKTALENDGYDVLVISEDETADEKGSQIQVLEESTEYFTFWESPTRPEDVLGMLTLKRKEEIQDITRRIKAIRTFGRLADELMDAVYRTLKPERGLIALVEKNGKLQPYGIRGLDVRKRERITLTPEMRKHIIERGETFQTPSTLCVPIKVDTDTIGFFYLDRKSSQEIFSEEDADILNFLSEYAAPYIENTYRHKNETVEETEPFLRWKPTIVRQIEDNAEKAEEWDVIIGKSKKMIDVFEQIDQVADTDVNVLLLGTSGTGKELVAKAIHERSNRRRQPFLTALCTAIPENVAESEFFGVIPNYPGFHQKEGLKGLFELADGGTVFLDEIGDMSRKIQEKILRVVEYKKMKRLGDEKERTVDVRIIAATKEDLKKAISERRFREDLFFKFGEIIQLPSLRSRKGDIPLLAHYFLDKYSEKYSARTKGISHGAMKLLLHYDWVNNARQLKGVVETSVIKSRDKEILFPWDLPEEIQNIELEDTSKADSDLKMDKLKREALIIALRRTGGNVTQTARFLGKTRQTIINWIKKYDIDVESFRKA